MTGSRARALLARYAASWLYLGGFILAGLVYAALPGRDQHAVLWWASTDVVNLHHDPAGCLVASAFVTGGSWLAWPALIALALFGANQVLGNWRTVAVCAAGQVVGTLVSEGIVDYRVGHGLLPAASARILDVGPSYVVVSAATVALLYGSRWARVAAAADFAILVFAGRIFSGLAALQVAAVGHTTAIVVAAVLGSALVWQQRRGPQAQPGVPRPLT
ncbi:MAG: rhomboid-like protein [Streptosporangiaceae bacterium]